MGTQKEKISFCSETTNKWYQAYTQANDMSGRIVKDYKWRIEYLSRMLCCDFIEIDEEGVASFIQKMEDRIRKGDLSRKTLRAMLYTYDSFADYLAGAGIMPKNPFRDVKKPIVDDVPYTSRIPNAEECDRMLQAAEDSVNGMFLIFSLALRMGLSTSEICDLKTGHVLQMDGKYIIRFPAEDTKDRYCPVPDDMNEAILSYLPSAGKEYFFVNRMGKKLKVQTLEKRVKNIMAAAGEDCEKYTLKDLRNRAIFQMLHDGATIEEVSKYVGLSLMRIGTFAGAPLATSQMLNNCPANLSKLKLV